MAKQRGQTFSDAKKKFAESLITLESGCVVSAMQRIRCDGQFPYAQPFALMSVGVVIPDDKVVRNNCSTRLCVNPSHLVLVQKKQRPMQVPRTWPEAVDSFWSKVNKNTGTECWEWMGFVSSATTGGYGRMTFLGMEIRAHIFSFMIHEGDIPDGILIRHTCDNRKCVNPRHLLAGTYQDNADDREERNPGRQAKGEKTRNSKRVGMTADKVLAIRELCGMGVPRDGIAARFGVAASTVSAIKNRRNWRHI